MRKDDGNGLVEEVELVMDEFGEVCCSVHTAVGVGGDERDVVLTVVSVSV